MQTCNPGSYFSCPQPDCDYFIVRDFFKQEKFKCPKCEVTHCFRCNGATQHPTTSHQAWLNQMRKEQREEMIRNAVLEIDEDVERWRKSVGARRCTQCKFIVVKNEGCDHMTCRCGYEFCYVCGGKYQRCKCEGYVAQDPEILARIRANVAALSQIAERKRTQREAAQNKPALIAAQQEAKRISAQERADRVAAQKQAARELAEAREAKRIEQARAKAAARQETARIAAEVQAAKAARVAERREAMKMASATKAPRQAAQREFPFIMDKRC